ncbi:MAG: hypothetical protein PHC64_02640 [Candidatus Gastranaerophilales bacterium]|nr:hypothetical protein [Candidatus Gastranaerophilales bacterium]
MERLLPPRGPNIYNAGIKDGDKGFVRYSYPSSKNPNLIIVDPISDDDGNVIMPGYYELILSADRQILVLAQSGRQVASCPVFKVEEDKTQEQIAQPMDNKSQKKADREKKKQEKKNKKLFREGKIESLEPEIYTNANIQYEEEGNYYLIKYERGKIRAWGAIK